MAEGHEPVSDGPAPSSTSARAVNRSFLTLGGGEAAARVVAFLATVYLARTLGADAYGAVAFALAVILYVAVLADFGVETLGIRDVAAGRARSAPSLIPSLVAARLGIAALCILVVGLAAWRWLPPAEGRLLAALSLLLLTVAASLKWVLLGLERAGGVALARTAGEALTALLLVVLVGGAADVGRVPAAFVAGGAASALLLLAAARNAGVPLGLTVDPGLVREFFGRSWPLVLQSLFGLVTFNADLIMLRGFRDAATVGYYAAAYALVAFLLNLGVAFGQSLLPVLTRAGAASEGERALLRAALLQVAAVALPAAALGSLLAPVVVTGIFSARYAESAGVLQLLLWSVPLGLGRTVVQVALIARGRQHDVMVAAGAGAAANIALNLVLIPPLGMTGAALATIATEVLRGVMTMGYASRHGVRFGAR